MAERVPFNRAELREVRKLLEAFNSGKMTRPTFERKLTNLLKQKELRNEKDKKSSPKG